MNIQYHVDTQALASRKIASIVCIVGGIMTLFFFFVGVPLLIVGCSVYRQHTRQCREFDFLRQYPTANFAQIGQALQIPPQTVYSDLNLALRAKILVGVRLDNARGVILYPTPTPPPPPVERLVTVACPHCGAKVTVSTTRGGQCEYCDSWLTGEVDG